jgi:hypothetical protein
MPDIPEGAKKPQDHAAKAEALDQSVAIEHNGQRYEIDRDALDDVETLNLIGKMQVMAERQQGLMIPVVVERILGEQQYAMFLRSNRGQNGRVPTAPLFELWNEIDTAAGKLSASSGS